MWMFIIQALLFIALLWCRPVLAADLEEGFRKPPRSAQPTVYWPWVNGNISREGIRADFEALKRVGLTGATMLDVSLFLPPGPVRYGSDEWFAHVKYAAEVANELGMEFGLHNCPGWSEAGGPWITPDMSMKVLVWSGTPAEGGKTVALTLPKPAAKLEYYRDVAVIAVPADPADTAAAPTITSNAPGVDLAPLTDGKPTLKVTFTDIDKPILTFSYPAPTQRRLLRLNLTSLYKQWKYAGQIQVSDDGQKFRNVRTFSEAPINPEGVCIPFTPTTARHFRVVFRGDAKTKPWPLRLAEVQWLDALRTGDISGRIALEKLGPDVRSAYNGPDPAAIDPRAVINLTGQMKEDGALRWEAPAGRWTILRFGYTTTGSTNHPAVPEGMGLEVDKFDSAAVAMHFQKALGRIIADAGPLTGRSFTHILCDSWEAGTQNWTTRMPELFKERQGYDLLPWLPALTGRVISSRAESEAFLNDFRQTIGNLYASQFYATMRKLANENKLQFWGEAYNGVLEEFAAAENLDVPMTEFWMHGMISTSAWRAAALAHTAGKQIIAAEAFTSHPPEGRWRETPGVLKPIGDRAFTTGINRFALHSFAHQPRSDLPPGFTHSRYGTQFSRLNTWWELSGPWIAGITRAQFLLQQGNFAADVLFFRHEDLERKSISDYPDLPAGYCGDLIALNQLRGAQAKDGIIRVPSGGVYRAIVMPKVWNPSLEALRELRRLAAGGAAIIGPAPSAPARLVDLRQHHDEWKKLAGELWKKVSDAPLAEQLAALKITPDFSFTAGDAEITIPFTRRAGDDFDLYFLCNPADKAIAFDARFREARGRLPELWNPLTGAIRPANSFQFDGQAARLRLALDAAESLFVVFRQPAPAEHTAAVLADGKPLADSLVHGPRTLILDHPAQIECISGGGQRRAINAAAPTSPRELTGPWRVRFQSGRGAPDTIELPRLMSLSDHSDPGVRYFSGTATYESTFTAPVLSAGQRCFLDVGVVRDLAEVWVNDKPAGILWTAPWRLDITNLLADGNNRLRIAVTNTWVNRLIGDEQLPADANYAVESSQFTNGRLKELPAWYNDPAYIAKRQRVTLPAWRHYGADAPLLPSGLLGPARLTFAREVTLD